MQLFFSPSFVALAIVLLFGTAESATRNLPPLIRDQAFIFEQPNFRAEVEEVFLNYRLPNETYPEHYDIKLSTNVHSGDVRFQGEVTIDIVVAKVTSTITLHTSELELSKVTITNPSTGESEELSTDYEKEREFLTLSHKNKKQFAADTKWKLTIIYSGKLRNDFRGFYLSNYTDDQGNERYLATTQFESTSARFAFPCYDEPGKRANFTITMTHSPTYTAVSNMPVNNALSSAGKTVFLTTDRIPTYIVAFIVFDFESTGGTLNNVTQHVYSRPNAKPYQEWALVSGMLITKSLSEYLINFMLPKLDHVAIPDFMMGAMENWGLATYKEENLLYNKYHSTVWEQFNIAEIEAHETAHQWFGDFVGIEWWTYLWLKEGFVTYFQYKALDDAYPEWGVWQQYHVADYYAALSEDADYNPRPLTHYVQTPDEISSLYDSISYQKGAAVIHMWSNALTEKVFRQGLHNYLIENQYHSVVEERLFTAIQNAAKEENYKIPATISEMMSSWSHQGGYPILIVTRDYKNGSFTVEQEYFHRNETLKDDKKWYVPINYAVDTKSDFQNTEATHYLLNVTDIKIDAKIGEKDWLILNKQSAYFYRIKYDAENYKLITKSLIKRPSKIHVRNRAQLINDAYRLSFSNRLDHATLLNIMTYLKKEDQYAPWRTASDIFRLFNKYLRGDDKYADLNFFIADQTGPIYEILGVNEIPGEEHNHKYTRAIIIDLACSAGVKDCLKETNNKLMALVKDNVPVEPNVETSIYCNGLRQIEDKDFEFVYKKFMDTTDHKLRSDLIWYFGCLQNESHIKKVIYSSIDESNKLNVQERRFLLFSVFSNSELGLSLCIDFLHENWNEYGNLETNHGNALINAISGMAKHVVNKKQEEKLLALVSLVNNSTHGSDTLEDSVKSRIANNFEWLNKYRDHLMTWITQYRADNMRSGSPSLTVSALLIVFAAITSLVHLFYV